MHSTESSRSFNQSPVVRELLQAVVDAFVSRLLTDVEYTRIQGGPDLRADIWYRMTTDDTEPTVLLTIAVPQPVYGLGRHVSMLASRLAQASEWRVDIRTKVRLRDDVDPSHLEDDGWRLIEFPPPLPPVVFSTEPPSEEGYQGALRLKEAAGSAV